MTLGHFEGKSIPEHLREARARGASAAAETHGTELSGALAAGSDAAKETAIALALLSLILSSWKLLLLFSCGFLVWKVGRSALLGWSRLERLHRLIEEERWEIEHHRHQEREELAELYQLKGFQGKLLEEVLDVLMADDDRLLKVMLEEELGLSLQTHEHPLRQACGAAVGVIASTALVLLGFHFHLGPAAAAAVVVAASILAAKGSRNRAVPAAIWNLSVAALSYGVIYFLTTLLPQ